MKINLSLIISIIVVVGVVAFGFTWVQIATERQKLRGELENKSQRMTDDFYDDAFKILEKKDTVSITSSTTSDIEEYGFEDVAIFYNSDSGSLLRSSSSITLKKSFDFVRQTLASDSSMGNFVKMNSKTYYQYFKIA
ncbi:MAG: hypothetical protein ABI415_07700, partial [Flavitalea sp.]